MSTKPSQRSAIHPAGRSDRPPHEVVERSGCVAAIVAGLVMGVHELWDDRVPGVQEGVVPSALHTTWVSLMFVALLGLSALQRASFGRLGKFAALVALIGTGALSVLALNETLRFARSAAQPTGDPPSPVMALMFAVFGLYVAGLLLFGIATYRAAVLPRSAGVLLVATVLLKMFASGLMPGTLALMGAAFIWLGVAGLLYQTGRSRPARYERSEA